MDYLKARDRALDELRQFTTLAASDNPEDKQKAIEIKKGLLLMPEEEREVLEQSYILNTRHAYIELAKKRKQTMTAFYRSREQIILNYYIHRLAAQLIDSKKPAQP